MGSIIRTEDIGKTTYDNTEILSCLSWKIDERQRWVLFGPNGSGKTALLQIIMGYTHQSERKIFRYGNECTNLPEFRKTVGYLASPLKEMYYFNESERFLFA